MGQIQATINQCDVCGHRWLSEEKPKRCAKCKSSKWDAAGLAEQSVITDPLTPAEFQTRMTKLEAENEKLRERLSSGEESGATSLSDPRRADRKAAKEKRQTETAKQVSGFLSRGGVKPCEHGYRPDLCRKQECRRKAQVG